MTDEILCQNLGCEYCILKSNKYYCRKPDKVDCPVEIEKRSALGMFDQLTLLKSIHKKLSEDHLGDDLEKMTCFLTGASSYQKKPSNRKSAALKGDPAGGKDNLQKTIIKNLPREDSIFLTSATKSVMEDDINKFKIISYSEVNLNREGGANLDLRETIKQMAEGGTSALKKDLLTGFKTSKHIKQEQKSVFYGTTESQADEELHTRFIEITIKTNPARILSVNDNSLDFFKDPYKQLNDSEESWIAIGIRELDKDLDVIVPYADYLKRINEIPLFDNSDPRSQRDVKRILSLTCAVAWLFQRQRNIIEIRGHKFILSEPQDFLNVIKVAGGFFNQTYHGFDARIQAILDYFDKNPPLDGTISRDIIQKALEIKSKNTIKTRIKVLVDAGLLEWDRNEGNKVYYRRCQTGCQTGLIRVNFDEIFNHLKQFNLKEWLKNNNFEHLIDHLSDPPELSEELIFSIPEPSDDKGVKNNSKQCPDELKNENTAFTEKIDTSNLTPNLPKKN